MAVQLLWQQIATKCDYPAGEYLFKEDDPGDTIYIIESGRVAVIKGAEAGTPLVLSYEGEGAVIGEISLLSKTPRSASVMAVEETTAYVIPEREFWALFDETPHFRHMIVDTLIHQIKYADQSRMSAAAIERDMLERFASLSNEHERMAEVMKLRQETLHFIVHDLRNPLNLVTTALAMLEQTPGFDSDTEMGMFVTMATGGVQRMLALVEAILDIERLEGGTDPLDLQPVNIADVITDVLNRTEPIAQTSEIKFDFRQESEGIPYIKADKERLDRVITNLVDNALKYTPPDGTITVSARADSEWLTVSVNDTGPGIPPEQRERIFSRFVQAGDTQAARRGFGLGLPYCRSAITAHGGRIWVSEGEDGIGSRFTFILPLNTHNP
jgi:signal transduction histidine kinase